MNIDAILNAYMVCALWSSTDDHGEPLDDTYTVDDITEETKTAMRDDVIHFMVANPADLKSSGLDDAQIGHDFWLTRNGHGAGFWDRGLGAVGDRLSAAAKVYGGAYLWVDGTFVHQG